MAHPKCPDCGRSAVVTTSRVSGGCRVQYYGCTKCKNWSLGSEVVPESKPRTRTVIGTIKRSQSGRFTTN